MTFRRVVTASSHDEIALDRELVMAGALDVEAGYIGAGLRDSAPGVVALTALAVVPGWTSPHAPGDEVDMAYSWVLFTNGEEKTAEAVMLMEWPSVGEERRLRFDLTRRDVRTLIESLPHLNGVFGIATDKEAALDGMFLVEFDMQDDAFLATLVTCRWVEQHHGR